MTPPRWRVGILATHPVQYYVPWYRALARDVDLEVFFSYRQTAEGQARAGYGVSFEWDIPLLDGYRSTFLSNVAAHPDVGTFWGCDTPEVARLIRDRVFDAFIVHGWATRSYWQALVACWRSGTPVMVRGDSTLRTPRPGWWRAVKWFAFRAFIPRFDAYLVVGQRAHDYVRHYGADPARCFHAPHAVDNTFFAQGADACRQDRARIRREFGVPEDAFVCLFAGRFVDMKRPGVFVEATASVAARSPTCVGLMVGDGPLRARLEADVQRRQLPVAFTGFLNQTDMPRAYAAADLFVLPSDARETWGLVVNEAMAAGLPVVVSDEAGCAPDLVVPGVTGEIVTGGSAEGFATAIARFADAPAVTARAGAAARRHIAQWDVAVAVAGTLDAVRAVQSRRPRRSGAGAEPGHTTPALRRSPR